jgi:hypothetical protein
LPEPLIPAKTGYFTKIKEHTMRRFTLTLALALVVGLAAFASAQTFYRFETVTYPLDTFVQLLGVNNAGRIAGYHNFTLNQGFTLILPTEFNTENFPNSVQTQVIAINNTGLTAGFYIDTAGINHGFMNNHGNFTTVDFPGTSFNQLLGLNDTGDAAGYYQDSQGVFHPYIYYGAGRFTIVSTPGVSAQATGINDLGQISGFYIDTYGQTHGFLEQVDGFVVTLDYPASTSTMALGLSNEHLVVGTYTDNSNNTHGFVYHSEASRFQEVNDPYGLNSTIINGVNDRGEIVGFYGPSDATIGFVGWPVAPW